MQMLHLLCTGQAVTDPPAFNGTRRTTDRDPDVGKNAQIESPFSARSGPPLVEGAVHMPACLHTSHPGHRSEMLHCLLFVAADLGEPEVGHLMAGSAEADESA